MEKLGCNCLAYSAHVRDGKTRWISNYRFNGLYKIIDDNVLFVGRFLSAKDNEQSIHACAKKREDRIYFFSLKNNFIDIYDININCFSCVEIKEWKNYKNKWLVFVLEVEDGFWLIPRYGELPIVKVDLDGNTQKVISIDNGANCETFCMSACADEEKNIYISCFNKNDIIKLNTDTCEYAKYSYEDSYLFQVVEYHNGLLYVSEQSNIRVIDKNMLMVKSYENVMQSDNQVSKISRIMICKDDLWIVPVRMKSIIKLNMLNGTRTELVLDNDLSLEFNDELRHWRIFKEAEIVDDCLVIYPMSLKTELIIDENDYITYKAYVFSEDSIPESFVHNMSIIEELDKYDLEGLFKLIL